MATATSDGTLSRRVSRRKPSASTDANTGDRRTMPTRRSGRPSPASPAIHDQGLDSPSTLTGSSTNRPWGRKGKAPMQVIDDEEEQIEEYDFSKEPQDIDEVEADEPSDDDVKSVISLSSEISAPEEIHYSKETKPWLKFTDEQRKQWEIMYSNVTPYAIAGSWAITEEYQREKDEEMIAYLHDFPVAQWILPRHQARTAYDQLVERVRWRGFGIPIYGRDRVPVWPVERPAYNQSPIAGSQQPGHREMLSHAAPPPPQQLPHHQFPQPPQPLSIPLQHIQYVPRTNNHHGQQQFSAASPQQFAQPLQPFQPLQQHLPPSGMGPPVIPPSRLSYGQPDPHNVIMPPGYAFQERLSPMSTKPRKVRERKETPAPGTPPPPPPTPPYETRPKPHEPRKPVAKPGRKTMRRQAEAEEFPWTRNLNFPEEKATATWDDTIYDHRTLEEMHNTRQRNVRVIDDIDAKLQEQQRMARANKKIREKSGGQAENSSDVEGSSKKSERKKRGGQPKGEAPSDPYHSGAYAWADDKSEQEGKGLGFTVPDEAIEAGELDNLVEEQMDRLRICWNPGKKGITEGLEQAIFSVKDTVLTRKQLEKTPILTRRAAECIIDFCPDMLWRGMLLRMASEGGYGNKEVRDRFCCNGCYCDKATITKRISAALGQKQIQPKSKGYQDGEFEWYEENIKDFTHYIEYFGRRTSHRNMLKIQMAGDKRRAKAKEKENEKKPGEPGDGPESSKKRQKVEGAPTSEAEGHEVENESGDESDDSNAVSIQDSDILDKMED